MALRLALQGVVADRAGGAQGAFDIALLDDAACAVGMMGPDAGIAVGLEFHAYRDGVGLRWRHAALGAPGLFVDAGQVLHMVADFMGDDIGLGKFTIHLETLRA